jgi:hypothetical protein
LNAPAFRALARQVYGYGWQSKLARALGRKHSTIWRMAHGKTPVAGYVIAHLDQLVAEPTRMLLLADEFKL